MAVDVWEGRKEPDISVESNLITSWLLS